MVSETCFANALFLCFAFFLTFFPRSSAAVLAAAHIRGLDDGFLRVQHLEAAGLDDLVHLRKSFGQQVLLGELSIGNEPKLPIGTQGLGGGGDELETNEGIGLLALMKRWVHHDGVKLGTLKASGDVLPVWVRFDLRGYEPEIASGAFEAVGIGIVDVQGGDVVAGAQQVIAQEAPAAAEVGDVAFNRLWQVLG